MSIKKNRLYGKSAYERVMNRIEKKTDGSDCWEYTGARNNAGYGMVHNDCDKLPKMITAHRAVAIHTDMPIDGKEVQHKCLNKLCVNPKHLVIGTAKTRNERMQKKFGRLFRKPKNPYKTCTVCGKTDYVVWFPRKHKDCK